MIAPTTPTSSEVTAIANNTDNVQVVVALDGCSLHSDPQDYLICVSVQYTPSLSISYTLSCDMPLRASVLCYVN